MANIRYNVPISLALEDKNHLSVQSDILALLVVMFLFSVLSPALLSLYDINVGLLKEPVKIKIFYANSIEDDIFINLSN
jgi:hypothetical protein